MAVCVVLKRRRNSPRLWKRPRLGMWFETEVMNWWENDRWIENFRMTKASFHKLCNLVKDKMAPRPNTVREPITLEARVAMCLYHLASSSEYRVTANQFGHSKSSVSILVFHKIIELQFWLSWIYSCNSTKSWCRPTINCNVNQLCCILSPVSEYLLFLKG